MEPIRLLSCNSAIVRVAECVPRSVGFFHKFHKLITIWPTFFFSSDVVEKTTFCQWVLKTDDPFQTFELEIEELDLNNDNKPPGQPCGDFLYVYGVTNIVNP